MIFFVDGRFLIFFELTGFDFYWGVLAFISVVRVWREAVQDGPTTSILWRYGSMVEWVESAGESVWGVRGGSQWWEFEVVRVKTGFLAANVVFCELSQLKKWRSIFAVFGDMSRKVRLSNQGKRERKRKEMKKLITQSENEKIKYKSE